LDSLLATFNSLEVNGVTLPCGRLIFCTLLLVCYTLCPKRESDLFFNARCKRYPLLTITVVMLDVLLSKFTVT
jgi:hypothetical protein